MHCNFKFLFRIFVKEFSSLPDVSAVSEFSCHVIRHGVNISTRLKRSQVSMSHCEF